MIVFIINIISALMAILGGFCMKKYAKSPGDYTIGFRTKRACASREAWSFANLKCSRYWLRAGTVALAAAAAAFTVLNGSLVGNIIQVAILLALTAALLISAAMVEKQLRYRYSDTD